MNPRRSLTARIALVALISAGTAIAILALGVGWIARDVFVALMMEVGDSADHAREMFEHSVTNVLVLALIAAVVASAVLALAMSRMLGRPLAGMGAAARRIASGDYAARVPRDGPEEVTSLADSFNQMALSLEEGERLRRDLIANTAHELRTPLTNLEGYLEGLRDGVFAADEATYESLLEEVERLARLARSLDDLAEGDRARRPSEPVDLDLAAQLSGALELARPTMEQHAITVERAWPSPLPARADPDQLAQVLANLLQNASRYTHQGGHVRVSAEPRPDATILVSITNSGEGIPADDLPHIFERFYRVEKSRDRARGGAGIGLAIVRQLVEGWGGRVGAESASGSTRIWFSVPAARA
jgi:signal transduction histidine kinase